MPYCAKCGAQYDEKFDGCPLCANSATAAPRPAQVSFAIPDMGSLLGYGGALLLLVGTFLPALKLSAIIINADYSLLGGGPFMAQMNASNGSPTTAFVFLGAIIALLAVATAVLVFMKIWPALWATGGLALIVIGYGFFSLTTKIGDAVKAAGSSGSAIASAIQPGWGWAVLLIGVLLVLATAFFARTR